MAEQQMSEEQIAALKEKIKNMSPEELKEFQKKQCIFCQIIAGRVQTKKIYEDEQVLVILDINPANPGHLLIMPKEHYAIMPQVPKDVLFHLGNVTKTLSNALLRSIGAQGSNVLIANGVAAGQRAQHFMMHLIPRKENDDLKFVVPQKTHNEDELKQIQEKLAKHMGTTVSQSSAPVQPIPQQTDAIPAAAPAQPVEAEFTEQPTEDEAVEEDAAPAQAQDVEDSEDDAVPEDQTSHTDASFDLNSLDLGNLSPEEREDDAAEAEPSEEPEEVSAPIQETSEKPAPKKKKAAKKKVAAKKEPKPSKQPPGDIADLL